MHRNRQSRLQPHPGPPLRGPSLRARRPEIRRRRPAWRPPARRMDMPIKLSTGILVLALAGPLSACATQQLHGPESILGGKDNFGEANRQTLAAQIVDPTPTYQTVVPETSAAHAAQAILRYNTDKVKKPEKVNSGSSSGSGGGGSSSSSSSN